MAGSKNSPARRPSRWGTAMSLSSKPQAAVAGAWADRLLFGAEQAYIGCRGGVMLEPAISGMTVEEFLRWDDGTDTRYELIDGYVVAMAPPASAHGRLAARLAGAIDTALRSIMS